jgi:hypothetical protein
MHITSRIIKLHSVTLIKMTSKIQWIKLNLLDYFSQSQLSSLSVKDKIHDKVISHLEEFIKSLPENDKQLYFKL